MVDTKEQATNYIVKTPGMLGGEPRIEGRRISVRDVVVLHLIQRMPLTQIAANYNLTLAQLHAALSYYYGHREEIDALIGENMVAGAQVPGPSDAELSRLEELREGLGINELEMTAPEIAAEFAISEHAVREAARKGWVTARKAGKVWLIRRGDAIKRWGSVSTEVLVDYKRTLIELFGEIQSVRADPVAGREKSLKIQERLITKIQYVELQVRTVKDSIKDGKRQLANHPSEAEAQELKEEISYLHNVKDQYQYLLSIFRTIGDALAYIYVSRWYIKPMAFKQHAGALSGKSGARRERKILRLLYEHGFTAILNDLTNNLRYGDIMIATDSIPKLVEVKSGKSVTRRDKRQQAAREEIEKYLASGESNELYKAGWTTYRIATDVEDAHHREQLNALIDKALSVGQAGAKVEDGLFYLVACDLGGTRKDAATILASLKVKPKGQLRFFALSPYREIHTAHYPLPLSIWNPEALFKYYADQLGIVILIDTAAIVEKLNGRGLIVEALFPDDETAIILRANGPDGERIGPVLMGRNFFARVVSEFMTLDWLADSSAAGVSKGATRIGSLEE